MDSTENFGQQVQRIEALVNEIKAIADPRTKACATELVQSLMSLHGAALERMMTVISEAAEPRAIIDSFARDKLIASLLVLYGLHPESIEERVAKALDRAQPSLLKHGASVELLPIQDGLVRLRLQVRSNGRAPSLESLQASVENAIYDAAPDVAGISFPDITTFVPIENLRRDDASNQLNQPAVRRLKYETATSTAAGND